MLKNVTQDKYQDKLLFTHCIGYHVFWKTIIMYVKIRFKHLNSCIPYNQYFKNIILSSSCHPRIVTYTIRLHI